ncbi:MAG TPA: glycosyltransferase family 4 protein [Anaerolineales bacterium]|nr:glycosyltransferase family 4 protein [Anaerolineales bacterium]
MAPLIVFLVLAALSYTSVIYIRRLALHHQILDHPSERSSHSLPMPRGGGLAIVFLVLGTAVWAVSQTEIYKSVLYVTLGAILALVGWRDDIFSLSPNYRFLVQGLVATISILVLGYFRVVRIPLVGDVDLGVVGIIITFLWIIGMINAYNFMDGIDGMAAGVAVVAGLGWMILSSNVSNPFIFWVALAIAATGLGFLGHNWPPAKIFMGDVASTFLGYSFAILPLLSADQSGDALTMGTLLMWTVIIDTFLTFLRRLVTGENVLSGHRLHLFQQLVSGGYKHGTISALYIFLTALAVLLTYESTHGDPVAPFLIFLGLPLVWGLLLIHASRLPSVVTTSEQQA